MRSHLPLTLSVAATTLVAGCAAEKRPPPPLRFERVVVHCYRTLAEPECFSASVPGERHRLTGVGVSGVFAVPVRPSGPGA